MKLSLIVAVVALALVQGSFAQEAPELAKISEYIDKMKTQITNKMSELISNQELASQAESLQTQLEPLASQVQEQLKTVAANVEEHIKPVATRMQAQLQPMMDSFQKQMEAIFQRLTEQVITTSK
uniref:Antifreeze protein type IV n=1 Tax=Mola mola TaxID=94237 RepID=A0A3Q3XJJ4_MOLML